MVLEDHIRKKRRLIPPVRAAMGDNYSPFSWSLQIVPELFWITLLINELGPVRGVEVARQLGNGAAQVSKKDPKPLFVSVSSFSELSQDEQQELLGVIDEEALSDFRTVLGSLSVIWPENPFSFTELQSDDDLQAVIARLNPTLEEMYNRHSRASTLAISTAVYLGFDQDKIKVAKEVFDNNATAFTDIEDYPATEASKKAGSFFRAMAPMLLLGKEEAADIPDWVDAFWSGLSAIGGCSGDYQDIPEFPDVTEGVEGFITAFTHFVHDDFRARESAWELDLGKPQERQVILALLARQATLAIEVVSNPGMWNSNTAPIMLRAMADVHITFVWLIQNPEERVPLYVQDGLGSIKLEIAHRKEELAKGGLNHEAQQKQYIEHLESWLESQQLEFLTEVNLGSWSGKNARVMAQEAGCIDFYNYVFQPFSAAVHSYWSHVGRINVEYCQNPAHNFHFLPVIPSFKPDAHWCRMAGKYLSKTLNSLDEFIGKPELPIRSYDVIHDAFG
ncbi:DUF5677 domain-containing protein [Rhizobium sp. WSM4643]|uniref:DUF5677 domain-containing protein n=1 Tax=Rhizobium sp. WSM4643 TaxID=3138253 RepID=UPI0021A94082|nr:DUF5677 domain-containing protein [Rhizobium leguminosarum]UWM75113.1 DUF5677 domain-containing protein [Rhizobium leguminosarum bv. viciae]